MALMAGIMLEDAAWLDEHRARAKETEHGRTRGAVELVNLDHDHSHEKGAADCTASALLAASTPSPEHGAGTEDYVMSDTLDGACRASAANTGAIREFIDADGSPAAVKNTLAVLCRMRRESCR